MSQPWTRGTAVIVHFCLLVLLCSALWIITGLILDLAEYPGRAGPALAVLLPGCAALGVLSRLCRRGRFVASMAVVLVTMAVLTEFCRIYVLDFTGGPPTLWVAFRDTAGMNAPYAGALSLLPLAGWYVTRALQHRRNSGTAGCNHAA